VLYHLGSVALPFMWEATTEDDAADAA
jgi:hypothetical protein